jgi:hypothetical protein
MKKSFETVLAWLSIWRSRGARPDAEPAAPMPEHERRLRELEKSGRILFLP